MTRKDFIKTSGFAAAVAAMPAMAQGGERVIRAAVVGCGGRGVGGSSKPKNENDFITFTIKAQNLISIGG